jgi:phosphonate transport system substrate-binding protein
LNRRGPGYFKIFFNFHLNPNQEAFMQTRRSFTRSTIQAALVASAVGLAAPYAAAAPEKAYAFNVLNQRSIALTAQYWNPILTYVSAKSGVPLELKLAKTVKEGNTAAEKGAYDFLYTNHFFTPERDKLGYRVIARPAGPGIKSQIVVPADSPAQTLADLNGKDVAFVSPDGYTGYWLPMDALLTAKVKVNVVFTGNQEASSAQLKVNKVAAAGVNSTIMARYGRREAFEYRALWTSELYQDLCVMANPKVPADKAAAVANALVGMLKDPQGRKILEDGAELLKSNGELGFVAAENRDYDNYRAFYKQTQVK